MPSVIQLAGSLVERRMSLTEVSERVGITVADLSILKTSKAKAVRVSTPRAHLSRARLPTGRRPRCAIEAEGDAKPRVSWPDRFNQEESAHELQSFCLSKVMSARDWAPLFVSSLLGSIRRAQVDAVGSGLVSR